MIRLLYRKHSQDETLAKLEQTARLEKRGLWEEPGFHHGNGGISQNPRESGAGSGEQSDLPPPLMNSCRDSIDCFPACTRLRKRCASILLAFVGCVTYQPVRAILPNAVVSIGACVIALMVSEVLIRAFDIVHKIPSGWSWNSSPLRHLQPNEALSEINELGLRGQPFIYTDHEFVVLLVGDSQVESPALNLNDMPEAILEEELSAGSKKSVKVFSIASSGWGQDQQLIALEQYFKNHRADLVLVWATPGNDFWENTFPDRSVTRDAGHLKPTFTKSGDNLEGPFFKTDFYFGGSAGAQFLVQAHNNTSINQLILDSWQAKLPSSKRRNAEANCNFTLEISQAEFFRNIFALDHTKRYTVTTMEDVSHSRSHFSPLTYPSTALDEYEKALTKELFFRLKRLVNSRGASFKVFYPIREDLDVLGKSIQCVRTPNGDLLQYVADFQSLLKGAVSGNDLLMINIEGKNENVVSPADRHLSVIGNKKAMKQLAMVLLPLH